MKNKISLESNLTKFGIGLFETIKVYKGIPMLLDNHLERIYNSINELNISFDICKNEMKNIIIKHSKNINNKALRLTIFDDGYNISLRDIPYTQSDYLRGYKLKIAPIIRGSSILYTHKTVNYLENIYSKKEALKHGFDESLFINMKNIILEGSMTNIFFIKDNIVYTPCESLSILPGIIRQEIIDICTKEKIKIKKTKIQLSSVKDFEFCFITNSLIELIKVSNIEDTYFKKENKLFKFIESKLKEKWYGCI
ncbi:4-amino-4-deoxychorismate lyase [Alkalithermobacter thermoalcaliphilus JW-YL-7 = DSM 7308]|uniref:4-amino-4-deoxychorismate lyase n=1 Tax=Alkalithermobacter thermoalcaliphilus JW-YL-7 = DSM 7308 TaxID=1121328 RepID=A0A150FQ45_CLOPD|nr:aminotransferase class IV [[Clostridium] paradoxum JW-YL-7 = DSM 7308]SHK62882.1 4-amino-4-deoxychorismate lyase [[Clostridium] paradoxum JW-YL-7 = DSM 7308]